MPEQEEIPEKPKKSEAEEFISRHVHYSKNDDDVLDVHIGNPLHKIVELLQEIKKQKAFSFTLKGSLGIAGVVLAFSFLGVLGAGNVLCSKGVQTQIGTLQILNIIEPDPPAIPVISDLIAYFEPRDQHNSIVIIKKDGNVVRVPYYPGIKFADYENLPVVATGSLDSCAQSLSIKDPNGIEVYTSGAN